MFGQRAEVRAGSGGRAGGRRGGEAARPLPAGGDLPCVAAVLARLAEFVAHQVLRLDPGQTEVHRGAPVRAAKAASWARRRSLSWAKISRATSVSALAGEWMSSRLASATCCAQSDGTAVSPCSAPTIAPAIVATESQSRP